MYLKKKVYLHIDQQKRNPENESADSTRGWPVRSQNSDRINKPAFPERLCK